MGTNYYLERRAPCETCHRPFDRLHIGKSSGGWVFGFRGYLPHQLKDYNLPYRLTTVAAWRQFISDVEPEGGRIVDEYGEEISQENFWKFVESKKHPLRGEAKPLNRAREYPSKEGGDCWESEGCSFSAYSFS